MYYLVPYRWMTSGKLRWRPLTEHDVVRARALAADLAVSWRGDAAYVRLAAANLAFAGLGPMLGKILLGWSGLAILCALTVDLIAVWLADVAKAWLAPAQVAYQLDLSRFADEIFHVAGALAGPPERYPFLPSRVAVEQRPRLVYAEFLRRSDSPWSTIGPSGVTMACSASLLFTGIWLASLNAPGSLPHDIVGLTVLFLPAVVRVSGAAAAALRAEKLPGSVPALFPQAYFPPFVLYVTVFASVSLAMLLPTAFARAHSGTGFLAVYALTALCFGSFASRRMRSRERATAAFLAADKERQLERLRCYNGDVNSWTPASYDAE